VNPALWYIVLIILIILSSFFSASETAFSSANLIRLRQYAEDGKKGAKVACELSERFEDVLLVILVLNNLVNFGAAGIATIVAMETFGEAFAILMTFIITIVMIVFGEIIPKSYARENAERFVLSVSGIYQFLTVILKPIIVLMSALKNIASKGDNVKDEEPSVTEDELDVIINTMEEEGVLEEEEVDMLQGVLDLSDTFVKNIMTPRADVKSINIEATVEEAKQKFLKHKFSRIPIYENSHDNMIGILYERELFTVIMNDEETPCIKELMKEPVYVSSSMRVSSLLETLRNKKQHLAIVIDEHGAASGIVTMEDVIEEVVGEIYDEHDEEEQLITKKSDTSYEVSAEFALDELCDLFNVNINEEDDVVPVGSWLYEKLEDIPNVGDDYRHENLYFKVTSVENRRIMRVLVELIEKEEQS
jgi:CBS domain containing-hemolysin-like protein